MELIIEKSEWKPPTPRQAEDTVVAIQVAAQEGEMRRQVQAVGGKWNPRKVVWELPYEQVIAFGASGPNRFPGRGVSSRGKRPSTIHLLIDGTSREQPSTDR